MFVVLLLSDVLLICCAVITHKEAYCVFKKKRLLCQKAYTLFSYRLLAVQWWSVFWGTLAICDTRLTLRTFFGEAYNVTSFFFFFCSHLDRAEKFKTFYKARYLHEQLEQYIVVNSSGGVEHSQAFTSRGRWFNPSFCICMCVHLCIHTLEIFQGGKRRN